MKTSEKLNRLLNPQCVSDWHISIPIDDIVNDPECIPLINELENCFPIKSIMEDIAKNTHNSPHGISEAIDDNFFELF
jgi:hypothetical protein